MPSTTSPANVPRMITALFKDRATAQRAFDVAISRGYDKKDVNIVVDKDTHERYTAPPRASDFDPAARDPANKAVEQGIELGGPSGGTMGTIVTALTAVGAALLLPGLGLVVAGPVAAALTGAGAAAVTGGLIAALHDWGIPNERVAQYEAGLKAGGILLGVAPRSPEDAAHLESEWKALGGENVAA